MTLKNLRPEKLRAKIIRKGLFVQLKYPSKLVEKENKLFRTILDRALYDLTSSNKEHRKELIEWFNPNNQHFKEICYCASLNYLKTYNMVLFILQNFFPLILNELYCYQEQNGDIFKFSPELTSFKSGDIKDFILSD